MGYNDGTICNYCESEKCQTGEAYPLYIRCVEEGYSFDVSMFQELDAEVSFDGSQFIILNKGNTDWNLCSFSLNNAYYYPRRTSDLLTGSNILVIKSKERVLLNYDRFEFRDDAKGYEAYDSYSGKPSRFGIRCENGAYQEYFEN